ncbi:MAG: ATP-binding cassette domain-containing protein [Serratia symbiotica]|nr:ATP-binding cassette domain-containing protein [Serratia symbiotica]
MENKITGLVDRNGAGKSILAALLAGERTPYSGSVTTFCRVGWLRQIGAEEKLFHYETVSDFLSVRKRLEALSRIAISGCDPHDFELIGDNWLLREELEQQLLAIGVRITSRPFLTLSVLERRPVDPPRVASAFPI